MENESSFKLHLHRMTTPQVETSRPSHLSAYGHHRDTKKERREYMITHLPLRVSCIWLVSCMRLPRQHHEEAQESDFYRPSTSCGPRRMPDPFLQARVDVRPPPQPTTSPCRASHMQETVDILFRHNSPEGRVTRVSRRTTNQGVPKDENTQGVNTKTRPSNTARKIDNRQMSTRDDPDTSLLRCGDPQRTHFRAQKKVPCVGAPEPSLPRTLRPVGDRTKQSLDSCWHLPLEANAAKRSQSSPPRAGGIPCSGGHRSSRGGPSGPHQSEDNQDSRTSGTSEKLFQKATGLRTTA